MKKILVPTDFSIAAEHALKAAVEIAKKTNSELVVMNIMDMPSNMYSGITGLVPPNSLKEFVEEVHAEAYKQLKEQVDKLRYDKITPILESGIPINTIIKVAEEREIDLIVMGTNGITGIAEWIVGSTTEKIVRLAPCPVLSLNQNGSDFKLKNIVFASDYKDDQYKSLDVLQELANAFDAKIHLVKIHSPQYFEHTDIMHDLMLNFARKNNLMNYTINQFNHVSIAAGIFVFARNVDADMVSMGTHGRKGISHLFQGSQTEDIVNRAKLPIFSLKVKKS